MIPKYAILTLLAAVSVGSSAAVLAAESNYPDRPINIVVPWGAGGGSDQMVRILAPIMQEALGINIAVSDVPGGTGAVGMYKVVSDTPDGYTIGEMSADTLPFMAQKKTPFSLKDMRGVCQLMDEPEVLFVNTQDTRFTNLEQFREYAKSHTIKVATAGIGGYASIMLDQLKEAGMKMTNIPENEPSKRYASLLGEHVDAMIDAAGNSLQYVDSNNFRPILVLDTKRHVAFPNVETAASAKLDMSFFAHLFRGLFVSSKVPEDRVSKLESACDTAFHSDAFQTYLKKKRTNTDVFLGSKEFDARLHEQVDKLAQVLEK